MIRTLLHYRNADSTHDLITHLSGFFKKGIVLGGEVSAVPGLLAVDIQKFKLIGTDGMVVLETLDTTRMNVIPGKNYLLFHSEYVPNNLPIAEFENLLEPAYLALSQAAKDARVIFAVVTVAPTDIAVDPASIDIVPRDQLDPVQRLVLRGSILTTAALPSPSSPNNRLGDGWMVAPGGGTTPALYAWNGVSFVNITDVTAVASALATHRANGFPNEKHLTENQYYAVQGITGLTGFTGGTGALNPSATNHFITENDPRLPSQLENDALYGLRDTTTSNPPSSANPYVLANFSIACPAEYSPTGVTGRIFIPQGEGTFFVGLGNAASTLQYFQLYNTTHPREYLNATGAAVIITGLYKNQTDTTPITPTIEPGIINNNGFYDGPLFIATSSPIDLPVKVRYGKQQDFQTFSRGYLLKPQPSSAQTTQEVQVLLEEITGRNINDPPAANESGVALRTSIENLRLYLNGEDNPDFVVSWDQYPRLRNITGSTNVPAINAYFPKVCGDMVAPIYTGSYTMASNPIEPDKTLLITSSCPSSAIVPPGCVFVDGQNNKFRIILKSVSGINAQLTIYTGGKPVAAHVGSNPNSGGIFFDFNPRQIEILQDFRVSGGTEYIPFAGVQKEGFEEIPPGGANLLVSGYDTLISTGALSYYGSTGGSGTGRPVYSILPQENTNLADPRIRLFGDWGTSATLPAAVGTPSQFGCGIEYTGRLQTLTLYTNIDDTFPTANIKVFVNGVYDPNLTTGLFSLGYAEKYSSLYETNGIYSKIPLVFNLSGSYSWSTPNTNFGTVRIEFGQQFIDGQAHPIIIWGIETSTNSTNLLLEEAGTGFLGTNFINLSGPTSLALTTVTQRSVKLTRFIDRTSGQRNSSAISLPAKYAINVAVTAGNSSFASQELADLGVKAGDVLLFTDMMDRYGAGTNSNLAHYHVTLVTNFTAPNNFLVEVAPPFNIVQGSGRIEYVFRAPTNNISTPWEAVTSSIAKPYLNLLPEDWNSGEFTDICNLSPLVPTAGYTVLLDGMTSLTVSSATLIPTETSGYISAINPAPGSTVVVSGWGTQLDAVFCGNNGPFTVNYLVDGLYASSISCRGDGVERITLFYDANPQTHTIELTFSSDQAQIVEFIFHDLVPPAMDGIPLYETELLRNSFFGASGSYQQDFTPTTLTTTQVRGAQYNSFAGIRVLDPLHNGVRLIDHNTPVGYKWEVASDIPGVRFGRYVRTNETGSAFEITTQGEHFELYHGRGNDRGRCFVYLNGTLLTSSNFPLANFKTWGGLDLSSGIFDCYDTNTGINRLIIKGIPATSNKNVFRFVLTSKNPSSSDTFISLFGYGECPHLGQAIFDKDNLYFAATKDIRPFLKKTWNMIPRTPKPTALSDKYYVQPIRSLATGQSTNTITFNKPYSYAKGAVFYKNGNLMHPVSSWGAYVPTQPLEYMEVNVGNSSNQILTNPAVTTQLSDEFEMIFYKNIINNNPLSEKSVLSAWGHSDNSSAQNVVFSTVSNKTLATLSWGYVVNLNSGGTRGDLKVQLLGLGEINRYTPAAVVGDVVYQEVDGNKIYIFTLTTGMVPSPINPTVQISIEKEFYQVTQLDAINTDVSPAGNLANNLGGPVNKWFNGYIGSLNIDSMNTSVIPTSSVTIDIGSDLKWIRKAYIDELHTGYNSIIDSEWDIGPSPSSGWIDWSVSLTQKMTLTGPCAITDMFNARNGFSYILLLVQGGSGSISSWPSYVKWQGNIPPVLSTTSGYTDILSFYCSGTGVNKKLYGNASLGFF